MTQVEKEDQARNDAIDRAFASLKGNLPESLLLSQMVGPAPAAGQPRAYVPPTAALRSEARDLLHQKALRDIVRLRFGFPTEKYRDFKTYVNVPQRTMGVQLRGSLVAYAAIDERAAYRRYALNPAIGGVRLGRANYSEAIHRPAPQVPDVHRHAYLYSIAFCGLLDSHSAF